MENFKLRGIQPNVEIVREALKAELNRSVFTASEYGSEDIALPEVVKNHVKQDMDHSYIYILDRGLQSTRNMKDFSDKNISFIVRAKQNRFD